MPRDRSVRMLVAAVLFVLALFIAMSYVVESRSLVDWWLPVALVAIGVGALVLDRTRTDEAIEDSTALEGETVYTVREYTFTDQPAVALAGPESMIVPEPEAAVIAADPVGEALAAVGEIPVETHEVAPPEQTQAERLAEKGELIQPADTAENEFQNGEHVAADQPTQMPPVTTVTTGEAQGEGSEPLTPEKKEVLDATSAPPQPSESRSVDPTQPEVADAVLSDQEDAATDEGLAPSEPIAPAPATGSGPDDLTIIYGIGARMQEALRAAGYDSFTKLAAASDEDLRSAIETAGMRLAPTLSTWREQAGFLARGDRAGFEALMNALHGADAAEDGEK